MIQRTRAYSLALLLLAFLATPLVAQEDVKLQLRTNVDFHFQETESAYSPCTVTITNRGKTRQILVEIEATDGRSSGASFTARRTLDVPPGEIKVEIPVYRTSYFFRAEVRFYVDGVLAKDLTNWTNSGYYSDNKIGILVVGGGDEKIRDELKKIHAGKSRGWSDFFSVDTLDGPKVFQHWQSYLGWEGILVLTPEAAERLSMLQREAISRWVCYGGGILWLRAESNRETFSVLDRFNLPIGKHGYRPEIACMSGMVMLSRPKDIHNACRMLTTRMYGTKMRKVMRMGVNNRHSNGVTVHSNSVLGNLFEKLHTIPRFGFIAISIFLAILIGPVNLYILQRKRKLAWFYFTAPALSLMGMVSLGAYSFIHDGIGIRGNELAILLHDQSSGRGAIYQARGMFAGLAPSGGLKYSADTAAIPFIPTTNYGTNSNRYTVDWTSAQHLASGWVNGRSQCGIMTITPVQVRMGVEINCNPDGTVEATNNLTGTIEDLLVYVGPNRAEYYYQKTVSPGDRVTLTPNRSSRSRNFYTTGILATSLTSQMQQATVLARAESIPHLDDGGLACNRITHKYLYVGTTPTGWIPQAEGAQ